MLFAYLVVKSFLLSWWWLWFLLILLHDFTCIFSLCFCCPSNDWSFFSLSFSSPGEKEERKTWWSSGDSLVEDHHHHHQHQAKFIESTRVITSFGYRSLRGDKIFYTFNERKAKVQLWWHFYLNLVLIEVRVKVRIWGESVFPFDREGNYPELDSIDFPVIRFLYLLLISSCCRFTRIDMNRCGIQVTRDLMTRFLRFQRLLSFTLRHLYLV